MTEPADHPVTAAGCAYEKVSFDPSHGIEHCKKLGWSISSHARRELVTANHNGSKIFAGNRFYQTEHVLFSGFSGDGAEVVRLVAIVRAQEIGVADIKVAVRSAHGIRNQRVEAIGQSLRNKAGLGDSRPAPLRRQMDRNCGNNPGRLVRPGCQATV